MALNKKQQVKSKAMKIETKFNVGDEVFLLVGTKLTKRKIHSLKVEVEKDGIPEVKYWFKIESESESGGYRFETKIEDQLFATKADFLDQLEDEPFMPLA
jgi:hypothetical protein